MPGLHDLHIHFEGFYNAEMLAGKTLRYTGEESSIAELQEKLRAYAEANPNLDVLFAEQLPQTLFPNMSPTRAFIDEVVPDRVVVMLSDSEHEALLNTREQHRDGMLAVIKYFNSIGITTAKEQHAKNHWAQGLSGIRGDSEYQVPDG